MIHVSDFARLTAQLTDGGAPHFGGSHVSNSVPTTNSHCHIAADTLHGYFLLLLLLERGNSLRALYLAALVFSTLHITSTV
jgi:hypothetical protein